MNAIPRFLPWKRAYTPDVWVGNALKRIGRETAVTPASSSRPDRAGRVTEPLLR